MKPLYGPQTASALQNFPMSHNLVKRELIYAMVQVKQAAAQANAAAGDLDQLRAEAIVAACREVLSGVHDDQFVVSDIQGGAGTSINMNVNEVLATLASSYLEKQGKSLPVHPLDHVNRSQSTNDVNPSGLKLAVLALGKQIDTELIRLRETCERRARECADIQALGRTHLQDAVPMTVGQEFAAWGSIIERDRRRISESLEYCRDLNLGGTAIGTGVNASATYRTQVYQLLCDITGEKLRQADNLMALTGSQTDFVHVINALSVLMNDCSKIASDIRLLSSGPLGGLGEMQLPEKQKGSTIMPGKVNPVIPETINQVYYFVSGKRTTVEQAAQAAQLQLGVMFPVLADALLSSLKVTRTAVRIFNDDCLAVVVIRKETVTDHLERSMAFATLLTPRLGYDVVSDLVHQAVATGQTLRQAVLAKKLMTEQELNAILSGKEAA